MSLVCVRFSTPGEGVKPPWLGAHAEVSSLSCTISRAKHILLHLLLLDLWFCLSLLSLPLESKLVTRYFYTAKRAVWEPMSKQQPFLCKRQKVTALSLHLWGLPGRYIHSLVAKGSRETPSNKGVPFGAPGTDSVTFLTVTNPAEHRQVGVTLVHSFREKPACGPHAVGADSIRAPPGMCLWSDNRCLLSARNCPKRFTHFIPRSRALCKSSS